MTVTVEGGVVKIDDYEINNEDVSKHFETLKEQGKDLDAELDKLLKLGAIAAKAGSVGLTTDYVDKQMTKVQEEFTKKLEEQFGENGEVTEILEKHLGVNGIIAKELLDPSTPGSPINKLAVGFLGEFDAIKTKLNIQETEQKGTQKGFVFEDYCYDILSKIAKVYGDTGKNR